MRKLGGSLPLLILALLFLPGPELAAQRRPEPARSITWDFETGDLRGWEASGTAFAFQPTLGDNPSAGRGRQRSNHQGRYWIGTFERYQGRPGEQPGTVQGDPPTGTLTSEQFIIPGGTLSFLVGGGRTSATRVELLIIDQLEGEIPVFSASGQNSETMRREQWDLSQYTDRPGCIRIVDQSSREWGHINVDDFRFSEWGVRAPDVQRTVPDILRRMPEVLRRVPRPVEVPDLHGAREVDVVKMLTDRGLELGRVGLRPAVGRLRTVIEQSPTPGRLVNPGDSVSVVLIDPELVEVPELVGVPLDEAVMITRRVGLGPEELVGRPSDAPEGTVIGQEPRAGQVVEAGTGIALVVAARRLVTVPDVRGRSLAEAQLELRRPGLAVGRIEPGQETERRDSIVEQTPAPGTPVPPGTPVDLVLAQSVRTRLVPVPDLTGLPLEAARRQVREAGLRVSVSGGEPGPVRARWRVLDQMPTPGTRVPVGTIVALQLSALPSRAAPPRRSIPWIPAAAAALVALAGTLSVRKLIRWRFRTTARGVRLTARSMRDSGRSRIETGGDLVAVEIRLIARRDAGHAQVSSGESLIEEDHPTG